MKFIYIRLVFSIVACLVVGVVNAATYSWDSYKASVLGGGWSPGDPVLIDGDVVHYYDSADRSDTVDEVIGALTIQGGGAFYCDDPADFDESTHQRNLTVDSIVVTGIDSKFECGNSTQALAGKFTINFKESVYCQLGYALLQTTNDQGFPIGFDVASAGFDISLEYSETAVNNGTVSILLDTEITSLNSLVTEINNQIDSQIGVVAYAVGSRLEFRADATNSNPSVITIDNLSGSASTGSPLYLKNSGTLTAKDSLCQGFHVMSGGDLHLFGDNKGHNTWTKASLTADSGTSLQVLDATGWKDGDAIAIASGLMSEDVFDNSAVQRRNLNGNPAGSVLTLDAALTRRVIGDAPYEYDDANNSLTYDYGDPETEGTLAYRYTEKLGSLVDQDSNLLLDRILDKQDDPIYQLDERTEIANLTRNIRFIGDQNSGIKAQGLGVHMMFMSSPGDIHVDGIEIINGGRLAQLARYPFHWHWAGDRSLIGDFFRNSSIHDTYNRCVTIHRTQNVIVEKNVCVNTIGHAYFLEDGDETGNLLIDNLTILAQQPAESEELLVSDIFDEVGTGKLTGPAAYWIANPDNILIGNSASSAGSGYWLSFKDADHNVAGTDVPIETPPGVFSGNRTHTTMGGFVMDGTPSGPCLDNPRNPCLGDTTDEQNRSGDHDIYGYLYLGGGTDPEPVGVILADDITAYRSKGFGLWAGSDNELATTHMVLADNRVGAGMVFQQDLKNSLVIGVSPSLTESEYDILRYAGVPEDRLFGALLYDGPEKFSYLHMAGFNVPNRTAYPFGLFGSAAERPQHFANHITFEVPGLTQLVNFFHGGGVGGNPSNWSTGLYVTDDSFGDASTFGAYSIRPDVDSVNDEFSTFFSTNVSDVDCKNSVEWLADTGRHLTKASVCPGRFIEVRLRDKEFVSMKRITHNANYPDIEWSIRRGVGGWAGIISYPDALVKANQSAQDPALETDLTYELDFKRTEFVEDTAYSITINYAYQDEWGPWFVLNLPSYRACKLNQSPSSDVLVVTGDALKFRAKAVTQNATVYTNNTDRDFYRSQVYFICGPDTDEDGILNSDEAGPTDDMDGDSIQNQYDTDNDNDGVADNLDYSPFNPLDYGLDTDGDELPDYYDDDDDDDSLFDLFETDTGIFVSQTDIGTDPLVSNWNVNSDGDTVFFDIDSACHGTPGVVGALYGEMPVADVSDFWDELHFYPYTSVANPFVADADGDGIEDFDEIRLQIQTFGPLSVYACGSNTNPNSKNRLLQGGNPICKDIKVLQGGVFDFRSANSNALFDGGDTTGCGSNAFWESDQLLSTNVAVLQWDLDILHKKHQLLKAVHLQSASDTNYNFPKQVEFKVSSTGFFAGEETSLGQEIFLPPNESGGWSNWVPVPVYDRSNRYLRIEIISQYELGDGTSTDPVRIAEVELLADEDNDEDGYSDTVELAEGSDPDDDEDLPQDTDGDFNPDTTDVDDDNDGLVDTEDSNTTNMLSPGYSPVWEVQAANDYVALGYSVSDLGDINNDGYADVVVGSPMETYSGSSAAGAVYILSGLNGAVIRTHGIATANTYLGYSVNGAGDVNGDGYADVIAGNYGGSGSPGLVKVYSGYDGSTRYTFNGSSNGDYFGYSVSNAGDVDNDGYADVIVGAPGVSSSTGAAVVYSGDDGSILYTFNGAATGDEFGHSVSTAGDVNGDGNADVVVGAFRANSDTGYIKIYSGADGGLLYTLTGDRTSDFMGEQVATAGDVNNDGYDDVLAAASGDDSGGYIMSTYPGYVRVFSGKDGATLYTLHGDDDSNLDGRSVGYLGDINKDGYDDLLVGDYGLETSVGEGSGIVRVYSGLSGTILYTFALADAPGAWFGYSVSGAGDVDNDGYVDVMAGAPWNTGTGEAPSVDPDQGSVHVYSGVTNYAVWDNDGDGMPNGWEATYGLNPASSSDATADLDEDGLLNVYEYQNVLAPNDVDSGGIDGLSDAWETIPYVSTVASDTPDICFDAGFSVVTCETTEALEYREIYFNSDESLVAYRDGEMNPNPDSCELAIEIWKPVNWSGQKATVWIHGGAWSESSGYSRDRTSLRPNTYLTTNGNATLLLTNVEDALDLLADDHVFVTLSYRGIYDYSLDEIEYVEDYSHDSDCTGRRITIDDVIQDVQEGIFHVVKSIPDLQPSSMAYPRLVITGFSAGGHLASMIATHGLDRLSTPITVDWSDSDTSNTGRDIFAGVVAAAGPADFTLQHNHYTGTGVLSEDRTLSNLPISVDETFDCCQTFMEAAYNLLATGYDCNLEVDSYDCFSDLSLSDYRIVYNTFANYYNEFSPDMYLIQGSADRTVPPEHSINICDAIADTNSSSVTHLEQIDAGVITERFSCGGAGSTLDLRIWGLHGGTDPQGGVVDENLERLARDDGWRRFIEGSYYDTDSDGLPDYWERQTIGSLANDDEDDNDTDGIDNLDEYLANTNPLLADTDGDGFNDGNEESIASDPLNRFDPVFASVGNTFLLATDWPASPNGTATLKGWDASDGTLITEQSADMSIIDAVQTGYDLFSLDANGVNSMYLNRQVISISNGVKLRAGIKVGDSDGSYSCVLTDTPEVWCGYDDFDVDEYNNPITSNDAVEISMTNPSGIAVGAGFACAIDEGDVVCWDYYSGSNTVPSPSLIANTEALSIAAGLDHVCAITRPTSGGVATGVQCWGDDTLGQLGPDSSPADDYVDGVDAPLSIDAGDNHTCVVNGTYAGSTGVMCWGDDTNDQLGTDSEPDGYVDGLTKPVKVYVGGDHSCAIEAGENLAQSAMICWSVVIDTDGDTTPDVTDTDDDNDGLTDSSEGSLGTSPLLIDTDGDDYCDGDGSGCAGLSGTNDADPLDPEVH